MEKRYGKYASNYRHGGNCENKPEYNSWRAMKERCLNPKYHHYHRYGGRGISIAKKWLGPNGFSNFLKDMGKKPAPKYTLDRIDNDGNYCKSNCRWADQKTQVNNSEKVANALVSHEQIENAAVNMSSVYDRIRKGWSVEDALTLPAKYSVKKRAEERLASMPDCVVCGKKCSYPGCKYCSRKCRLSNRDRKTGKLL